MLWYMVIRLTKDVWERISSGVSNILGVKISEITDVNTSQNMKFMVIKII